MPERTTVAELVQVGVEVTPGTLVPATKLMQALSIDPHIMGDFHQFAPMGSKFNTLDVLGKEWSEAAITAQMTYDEIIYPFATFFAMIPGTQIGVTTAYKWVFDIASNAPDTVKSFTVEKGSSVGAESVAGMVTRVLNFTVTRSEATMDGTMMGLLMTTGATLTPSGVTTVPMIPILPKNFNVFLDSTAAGLGTTKLLRVISVKVELGDRFNPLWALNSANTSYAVTYERKITPKITMVMEKDAVGMALVAAMRAGASRFLRLKATGPAITTSAYDFQFDAAVQVSAAPTFADADGLSTLDWVFDIVHDGTWGKALHCEVINTQTALG